MMNVDETVCEIASNVVSNMKKKHAPHEYLEKLRLICRTAAFPSFQPLRCMKKWPWVVVGSTGSWNSSTIYPTAIYSICK